MALRMSRPRKNPHGTYYLIQRVPKDLVHVEGRSVIKLSLRTKEPSIAKEKHAAALAEMSKRWAALRQGPTALTERRAHELAEPLHDYYVSQFMDYPSFRHMWHEELYLRLWTENVEGAFDESAESTANLYSMLLYGMRDFCFDQADACLKKNGLIVDGIGRMFLAKAMGAAVQRACLTLGKLAEGYELPNDLKQRIESIKVSDEIYKITLHELGKDDDILFDTKANVSISKLYADWKAGAIRRNLKPSTFVSYGSTIEKLISFLGHDNAGRVSRSDVLKYKNYRLLTPSPKTGKYPSGKTVRDSDIAAIKSVFGWGFDNDIIAMNPAERIVVELEKKQKLRSSGFTDDEARRILLTAYNYRNENENTQTVAAKKWVPWLCAFSGARVGEMVQLGKQDIRNQDGRYIIRITPEAHTQKTNEAREVILHQQIVDLGFISYVDESSEGFLFIANNGKGKTATKLKSLANRVRDFSRESVPELGVGPTHGWRHRFKTLGYELGIERRVLDAIQGHAPQSVSDRYGEISLKAMTQAIDKMPRVGI